jgi:signal recognition particle subunit SRP14
VKADNHTHTSSNPDTYDSLTVSHGQDLPQLNTEPDVKIEHPAPEANPGKSLPVIIHATNGKGSRNKSKKVKLSTVVEADAVDRFYAKYADVCKAGMTALKPRDRSRKKLKAKKKKGAAAPNSATI